MSQRTGDRMSDEAVLTRSRRMLRLTTASAAGTLLILVALGVQTVASYRAMQRSTERQIRFKELIGRIVHLDEVLTMSARMASVTGDAQWEARYHQFEGPLEAAIQEARSLTSVASGWQDAARTEAANVKLVAMEHRAFELVRRQHLDEARGQLFSVPYEEQKLVYAEGMRQLTEALAQEGRRSAGVGWRRISWALGGILLALALLTGMWLATLRAFRHWQRALLANHQELRIRAEQLKHINVELDRKVTERTAELTATNALLVKEIAQRERAQQQLSGKIDELKALNGLMMGREERILGLKDEVNALCKQLQLEPKYGSPHA